MVFKSVKEVLSGYLSASSIHGMQYLNQGWNQVEKVIWLVAMISSLTCAGYLIQQGMQEAMENPMLVAWNQVPVDQVPFPAVTISAENNGVYPFGFQQRMLDLFTFYNHKDFEDSKEIREYFKPIIREVLQYYEGFINTKNHQELNQLMIPLAFLAGIDLLPEADKAASIFAKAKHDSKYESILEKVSLDIKELILDSIFKYRLGEMGPVLEKMKQILDEAQPASSTNLRNWTDQDQLQGKRLVALPFAMNPGTGETLGLGSWVMHFQKTLVFLDTLSLFESEVLTSSEKFLKQYWKSAVAKLAKVSDNLDTEETVFDVVAILDNQNQDSNWNNLLNFSPAYQKEMGCDPDQLIYCMEQLITDKTEITEECKSCHKMLTRYEKSLSTVLKVFRYSLPAPVPLEDIEELKEVYDNLTFLGSFKLEQPQNHWFSTVLTCDTYGPLALGLSGSCRNKIFHRSMTNNGLGHSYNVGNFWDLFKNTSFTRTFAKIMTPKGHHLPLDIQCWKDDECKYPSGSVQYSKLGPLSFPGTNHNKKGSGWHLVLHVPPKRESKEYYFKISIHDPMALPDLRSPTSLTMVKAGTWTHFHVTPTQEVTSASAKSMPEEQRNCRFPSESLDSDIFKRYSRSGCFLECQLKRAYKVCQCIPWNYPHFQENQTICNRLTQICFENEIENNVDIEHQCHCPNDCSQTSYSFALTQDVWEIKPDLCQDPSIKEWMNLIYPAFFVHYDQLETNQEYNNIKYCQEYLKNYTSVVTFHMTKATINQLKRSPRVTWAGHLANIGGTLGLFSGISLLSLFEIFFWMFRLLKSKWNRQQ